MQETNQRRILGSSYEEMRNAHDLSSYCHQAEVKGIPSWIRRCSDRLIYLLEDTTLRFEETPTPFFQDVASLYCRRTRGLCSRSIVLAFVHIFPKEKEQSQCTILFCSLETRLLNPPR